MHHLMLYGDWPDISNYGGCAHWASSECLHYVLHPPSSLTKNTTNSMTIFTLKLVAMSYAYIQYSAKLIALLYLVILPSCVCVFNVMHFKDPLSNSNCCMLACQPVYYCSYIYVSLSGFLTIHPDLVLLTLFSCKEALLSHVLPVPLS